MELASNFNQVIIHIGPPKTGSSAIQKWLSENLDYLQDQSIFYPAHKLDENGISSGNFEACFELTDNKRLQFSPTRFIKLNSEFCNSDCKVLLLSSEYFFQNIDVVNEVFGSCKFIAYIRSPLELFESSYNQAIKRHNCVKKLDSYFTFSVRNIERLDEIINRIGFGRFILRPYEREAFFDGNIVNDFLKFLQVDICINDEKPINQSYSVEALEFKRLMNHFHLDQLDSAVDKFLQNTAKKNIKGSFIAQEAFNMYKGQSVSSLMQLKRSFPEAPLENLIHLEAKRPYPGYIEQRIGSVEFKRITDSLIANNADIYYEVCHMIMMQSYLPIFKNRLIAIFLVNYIDVLPFLKGKFLKLIFSHYNLKTKVVILKLFFFGFKYKSCRGIASVKGLKKIRKNLSLSESIGDKELLIQLALLSESNENIAFSAFLMKNAKDLSGSNSFIDQKLDSYIKKIAQAMNYE
jgi:hypothetical protein